MMLEPLTREEMAQWRSTVMIDGAVLVLTTDTDVTVITADDPVDENGERQGMTMPIVGTVADTIADIASAAPDGYRNTVLLAGGG